MDQPKVKRIRVRELLPESGDRVRVMTLEKTQELDLQAMVTVFPNGEVVHTWNELLTVAQRYPQEEVEIIRFAPMMGG